jgi:hypothetical protein
VKSVEKTEFPSTLDSIARPSSFQWTYPIVTGTPEAAPKISPKLEPAAPEPTARETMETRMFEPAGLFLAATVGTAGLISLLKGAFLLAALCLPLASLGLVVSHRHFDR